MGYGEMTGNGSVHWRIDHETEKEDLRLVSQEGRPKNDHELYVKRRASGRDPKKSSHFDVVMRFESAADARRELERALRRLPQDGEAAVTIRVPSKQKGDPDIPAEAEVRVNW